MPRFGDTLGLAVFFVMIVWVTSAQAKTICVFDTECFESEACSEAAFQFDYDDTETAGAAESGTKVLAKSEFGDLTGTVLKQSQSAASLLFDGPGAQYLLTREGGAARLSVHMDGPMAVTYLGSCEVLE